MNTPISSRQPFRFKQFQVHHERSTMKVGTDAVLLGAWADCKNSKRILDIGTGCGVVALILAQRTEEKTIIEAIDIDQDSVTQAGENFAQSPWSGRLKVSCQDATHYHPAGRYDLIVSNPPYFRNSSAAPSEKRNLARHDQTLTSKLLIEFAKKNLSDSGAFSIILPTVEGSLFQAEAEGSGFHMSKMLRLFSKSDRPQERSLLEFKLIPTPLSVETLVIHEADGQWSEAYKKLTKDFYLAF